MQSAERITETEYKLGKRRRQFPDELGVHSWYMFRETFPESVRAGCFAVQMLIEVKEVTEVDGLIIVTAFSLDEDGRKNGEESTSITPDGITYDADSPEEEGYFVSPDHLLPGDLPGVDIQERIPVLSA